MATENNAVESEELPEPEGEETEAGGEVTADEPGTAEPRQTRAERRASWVAERKRETEELRAEVARERQARQQFEMQMAEMRGQLQAQMQVQRQSQEDPHEAKVRELMERAERHLSDGATAKDPAAAKAALNEYHKTMREVARVEAQATIAQERQQWSQQQMDPGTQAMANDLGSEFRWLRSNPAARAVADAFIAEMVGAGHPDGYETYRAACARAAHTLGLGGEPTTGNGASTRRFVLPTGKNGAANGGEEPTMKLDEHQQAMADHWANRYHPNLSEEAGRKMWWNAIGKRAAKAAG